MYRAGFALFEVLDVTSKTNILQSVGEAGGSCSRFSPCNSLSRTYHSSYCEVDLYRARFGLRPSTAGTASWLIIPP